MAKNKQKQKGLLESVHDGYVRGSMGGEEDTSQARIVTSPEPLPDEIKKFKLPANVTADELFVKMQPVFISKYNWGIERGDNGELTILDKKYKYDVNLEEDGTFVIWWRMSVAKAFLSTRHYPIYKNAIATMGIIAYEVQQVFPVVEEA